MTAPAPRHEGAGQRWRPEHRLRRRPEYVRCYRSGRRVDATGFRLYVARSEEEGPRFGITAGRKVGKAAVRQRTRRRVREILRRWPGRETLPALDVVVHLEAKAASLTFDELRQALEAALERARGGVSSVAGAGREKDRNRRRGSSSRRRGRR